MGTQDPLVHIEAATLAGGNNNQDRYAYGDGWAFVLDGATSYSEYPPIHDGGWYAEQLKDALVSRLGDRRSGAVDLVSDAIAEASSAHATRIHGPCPTSTIALAKWDSREICIYLLGDSFVLRTDHMKTHEISDNRIADAGEKLRSRYRKRLASGSGFDDEHRRILVALQQRQMSARNKTGGYWIAGEDREAAYHGITRSIPVESSGKRLLLCTDGVSDHWRRALGTGDLPILQALENQNEEEDLDSCGVHLPRSKTHDDKTAVRSVLLGRRET